MDKRTNGERIFGVFNILLLLVISAVMILPYLNVLARAFNNSEFGSVAFWPKEWTLKNFSVILSGDTFKNGAIISVLRVVIGTVLALVVQFSAAYALSRKKFPGKSLISTFFMVPMYIAAGQIPLYVLFSRVGLLNNFWVYILPSLFSFYNIVIIRTYIQSTIPISMEESALIDGANEIVVFFRIILPLCKPILATIALWTIVNHWNDWTTTLLYVRNQKLYPLQYVMMEMVKESERIQKMVAAAMETGANIESSSETSSDALISAQIIVTTIPIVCIYPFLQKYFVKGIMIGSVKG